MVEVDLDLSIMQEMFDILSNHQDVPVEVTCVYDQDVNDYFIDGDEDKSLNIRTAKKIYKAAESVLTTGIGFF